MDEKQVVNVKVSVSGLSEALKKSIRLTELLKEANSLADELASIKLNALVERDV